MNPLSDHEFLELRNSSGKQCFVFSDLGDLEYPAAEISKIKNGTIHSNYRSEAFPSPPLKTEPELDPDLHSPRAKKGRTRCLSILALLIITALLVGVPIGLQLRSSSLLEARLAFVRRLLSETPLIEGYWIPSTHFNESIVEEVSQNMVGSVLWPILVPCGSQYLDAVQLALEGIDKVKRFMRKDPVMTLVENAEEMEQVFIKGDVAVLIGLEGGHAIGSSLAVLRSFHVLGIRFLSLAGPSCTTPWAKASTQKGMEPLIADLDSNESKGLAEFGELVLHEVNRLGMLAEISKLSEEAMILAMHHTKAPLLLSNTAPLSHCNATAVPDHILSRLTQNGGVVMLNVEKCGDEFLSVRDAIMMINYVRQIAGMDHIGLSGSPKMYPQLLAELARDRLWSSAAIKKLVGGNLMRVLREVENAKDRIPLAEDWIPQEAIESNSYCRAPESQRSRKDIGVD